MSEVSPLRVFKLRAEVRALLLAAAVCSTWEEAFAPLLDDARDSGLDDDIGIETLHAIIDASCAAAGGRLERIEEK